VSLCWKSWCHCWSTVNTKRSAFNFFRRVPNSCSVTLLMRMSLQLQLATRQMCLLLLPRRRAGQMKLGRTSSKPWRQLQRPHFKMPTWCQCLISFFMEWLVKICSTGEGDYIRLAPNASLSIGMVLGSFHSFLFNLISKDEIFCQNFLMELSSKILVCLMLALPPDIAVAWDWP